MSNITNTILDRESNSRLLGPTKVGFQVALMLAVSIATVVTFNFLRPKNKVIYEPKVKYHIGDKSPPRISDTIFGWLPPLYRTKESELLDKIGLDAVTFLRFGRMMRNLFCCIVLLGCGVLIPFDVIYNLRHVPSTKRDALSMLTIRDVQGPYLYAHIAASYAITFLVSIFIWWNWRCMLRLRQRWFQSPEYSDSLYARTLIVTNVPKDNQTDEGIRAILESVQAPYSATSVHIGRKIEGLPELIERHDTMVCKLEQDLVTYLKGGRVGKKRPTLRSGGFLGLFGAKKDRIDFYTEKLQEIAKEVESDRQKIETYQAENYGFASMAMIAYAHVVARTLRKKHPHGTNITLAPNPRDIIWRNLGKSASELRTRWWIGFILLVLVCFFNTIPLLVISTLANLNSLSVYITFLAKWAQASPGSFSLVSGVIPPAISACFGFLLPIIIRWITEFQGVHTYSRRDRVVVSHYFTFLVISQLIIFTLIGVFYIAAEQVISNIGYYTNLPNILHELSSLSTTISWTYIDQETYWLTFIPLRGFLVIFDLAQILSLILTSLKTRLFGRTPRDIRGWTQPPEFQYDIYYSNTLFLGTVAFVFAPLAPLVSLAAAIVFTISSWIYKYQLMFVFVTRVETGGRLWNMVVNRILVSVVLMQLLLLLTIGLQYSFKSYRWAAVLPPMLYIAIFKVLMDQIYYNKFMYYTPSKTESRESKIRTSDADEGGRHLEKRFGQPSLHAEMSMPLLHASMMPFLTYVYQVVESDKPRVDEYGHRLDVRVVGGGLRIAGIEERNLECDPALYGRDRGELDLDVTSVMSTAVPEPRPSAHHVETQGEEGENARGITVTDSRNGDA